MPRLTVFEGVVAATLAGISLLLWGTYVSSRAFQAVGGTVVVLAILLQASTIMRLDEPESH